MKRSADFLVGAHTEEDKDEVGSARVGSEEIIIQVFAGVCD